MNFSLTSPTAQTPRKHAERDGIEMGVLANGTPYLTARGLANFCGVSPSVIISLGSEWGVNRTRPRGKKIIRLLEERGIDESEHDGLFEEIIVNGQIHNAYTDQYVLAILEYYAFEASDPSLHARNIYRKLARASLREIIYRFVGFDPDNNIPLEWQQFHDRLMLNQASRDYFSVFMEMSDMVLAAIQHGLIIDDHTIPDISVGRIWSKHWRDNNLDEKYKPRTKHPHYYPDYFPQSGAGPVDAWIYPLEALGEFRLWMQNEYLPNKFPAYLDTKRKKNLITANGVTELMTALVSNQITSP